MPKKVGIVTYHHASSYGAVLQAYALQQFLSGLGVENEIINYRCRFIEDRARVFKYIKGKSLKNYIYSFLLGPAICKERKNSAVFAEKFFKMTEPYTRESIDMCRDSYDIFLTGSDQVFSPVCAVFDPVYFLDFAKEGQKYSYAASFGRKELPEEKKEEYKKRLYDFSKISVREESGTNIVKNLLDKEAIVHIDPTLLLTQKDWDRIASEDIPASPYIFLFTVLNPNNLVEEAIRFAEKTGFKILYLNKRKKVKSRYITYIDPVTADQFVGLIKNAAYVFTNSFHGNAFSLIYHKKFIVETDTKMGENNRSRELMIKVGLQNRILAHDMEPDIEADTNWDMVDAYLAQERQCAKEYLSSITKKERET